MMKNYFSRILITFLAILSLFSLTTLTVFAEDTEEDEGRDAWTEDTVTTDMVLDELYRIAETSSTSAEAKNMCLASTVFTDEMKIIYCNQDNTNVLFDLVLDFDETIKLKEQSQLFYTSLWKSTQTATTVSFDLFDWGTSILTVMINAAISIIEAIGGIFSIIVLFITNIASSNYIGSIIRTLANMLHNFIFGDMENAIMILFLIFMIAFIRNLLNNPSNFLRLTSLLFVFKQTVIGFLVVVLIALPGRDLMYKMDQLISESVAVVSTSLFKFSSDFEGDTSSTVLKSKIFYIMQEQPFMLRHYGVMSEDSIAKKYDITTEEATARYKKLIADPSQANAKVELKKHNNSSIPHDLGSLSISLLSTIVMLFHKIILGLCFGLFALLLFSANSFKEVIIGLSFTSIFEFAMNRNFSSLRVIGNKISWIFILSALPVVIVVLIELMIAGIALCAEQTFLLVFVMDIIILLIVWVSWKNKEKIISTISTLKEPIQAIATGDYSVRRGIKDFTDAIDDRLGTGSPSYAYNGAGNDINSYNAMDKDLSETKSSSLAGDLFNDNDSLAESRESEQSRSTSQSSNEYDEVDTKIDVNSLFNDDTADSESNNTDQSQSISDENVSLSEEVVEQSTLNTAVISNQDDSLTDINNEVYSPEPIEIPEETYQEEETVHVEPVQVVEDLKDYDDLFSEESLKGYINEDSD